MATSIYVGNLPFETTGEELAQLFEAIRLVTRGEVILDSRTHRQIDSTERDEV